MPEIQYQYGYRVAIGVTTATTLLTFWYFKRKKWF
jgi:Mg2+ and Co2+ transporter CorA